MSAEIRAQLASAFEELVIEMQALDWWTLPRPSLAALASEQPFAADTMAFNQWLRWVFVERLQALLIVQRVLCRLAVALSRWLNTCISMSLRKWLRYWRSFD